MDILPQIQLFEIDQPGTQAWKQQRLNDLGVDIPPQLHFVPVNFETTSWWKELLNAGFDTSRPAVVTCTGVSLYLTKEVNITLLKQLAALAPGSTIAVSFYSPTELLDEEDKPLRQIAEKRRPCCRNTIYQFFYTG